MKTIQTPALGTKVQLNNSDKIWTVTGIYDFKDGGKSVQIRCIPKGKRLQMQRYIEITKFNKNWTEV